MAECIALFRGINVGRAKRVTMGDLRSLLEGLGHRQVRTLLNSGNVLFQCARPNEGKLGLSIQRTLEQTHGFSAAVTVITAAKLAAIVRDNPLLKVAKDPSRHFVAFVANPKSLVPLRALLADSWEPDVLSIGAQAAYLWCVAGALDSPLSQKFARRAGETVTLRNWATVLKLLAASNAAA
jgi:uncharacterized protein (DUF1697 family)